MKKVFIITWKANNAMGFEFNADVVFNSADEAKQELKELSDEATKYEIKEVDEVFIYLANYLNFLEVKQFTNDENELELVYDFFENVKDEKLIMKYLNQSLYGEFYTHDRSKFIQREINYLNELLND